MGVSVIELSMQACIVAYTIVLLLEARGTLRSQNLATTHMTSLIKVDFSRKGL